MPRLTLQMGDRPAALLDAECQAAGVDRAEYARRALATYAYLRSRAAVAGRVRFAGPDGRPKDLVLDGPRVSRRAMPAARLAGSPVDDPDPAPVPSNPIPFRSPQPHAGTPMPTETSPMWSKIADLQTKTAAMKTAIDDQSGKINAALDDFTKRIEAIQTVFEKLAAEVVGTGDIKLMEQMDARLQKIEKEIVEETDDKSPETDGDNTQAG